MEAPLGYPIPLLGNSQEPLRGIYFLDLPRGLGTLNFPEINMEPTCLQFFSQKGDPGLLGGSRVYGFGFGVFSLGFWVWTLWFRVRL